MNYTPVVRSFLSERFPKGAVYGQQITAADITAFVQRQATLVTSKRAPLVVTALRSFLRYLLHRGIVAIDLAACVPTIATWSLSNVSVAICSLVDKALERAGVESEYRGSHVFRHSLATVMLNNGASLPEIGDLLRHRRPDTTRIYAKVDLVSLRSIALPWPGGSR